MQFFRLIKRTLHRPHLDTNISPAVLGGRICLGLGLLLLAVTLALAVQQVYARSSAEPVIQASALHPTFALLDETGQNVVDSAVYSTQAAAPVSTMKTCGQCHDTDYITSHSFHADLGWSAQASPGETAGARSWDTSTGLYGKWDPLTYRYLSAEGDSHSDLNTAGWVAYYADRLVGGGPAASSGVEMNCFLCHLTQPNNEARIAAIRSRQGAWASTATLLGTGIVEQSGDTASSGNTYLWNQAAFTDGELTESLAIQDPDSSNCGQCHGVVQTDAGAEPSSDVLTLSDCSLDAWQSATTGQVLSAQRISLSGMNLANKADLTRSWDIHAERGLNCTDCHYSLNNPVYYQADAGSRPEHLEYDPRRLEISEFLSKPDHNFARGQSAQYTLKPEQKGSMRRCESCHNTDAHANWLPYAERHMEEVACETCHIPQMYAPAIQSYDWTVLQVDGQPVSQCRGAEMGTGTVNDLVTGFQPVLMLRENIDGGSMLAPYNLITAWYWVYDTANGPRPVSIADLNAAWLAEGDGVIFAQQQVNQVERVNQAAYAPEVLQALDTDGNGTLSSTELKLDTPEKQAIIASRLSALGLQNPRIQGDIQPYSINHNVTRGEWATSECQACHSDDSRLAQPMRLAAYLPGSVMPDFVGDSNTVAANGLYTQDGALYYQPAPADYDLYVFGHNRISWIDWFGALFFVGVLAAVAGHGGLRLYHTVRQPRHGDLCRPRPHLKKVYMYAVYERFWHWLQTFTIVLLLFTGLVIHRPEIFGIFSFRYIVIFHNVLAAILVINAALSLFYHLASGEIRQFIPRPHGFFDQAIVQAKYYLQGIFKGAEHPFEKTPQKKLNPLQQATYFAILNILLPLQIITGALMWGVQKWPKIAGMLGGLPYLAPFHSLVAWMFAAFIVAHVYLTTTGHEPLSGIKAMINGWEDLEVNPAANAHPTAASPLDTEEKNK